MMHEKENLNKIENNKLRAIQKFQNEPTNCPRNVRHLSELMKRSRENVLASCSTRNKLTGFWVGRTACVSVILLTSKRRRLEFLTLPINTNNISIEH